MVDTLKVLEISDLLQTIMIWKKLAGWYFGIYFICQDMLADLVN